MNNKTVKFLASAALLLVTVIWGSTFVTMKNSMDVLMPMYLLAYRFTIASAGLVIVFYKSIKNMTRQDVKYGCVLGILLFLSYAFQTYGLKYTTASKNAFITTLYVIIVPFLHWLFNRVKPSKNSMAAAVIAVIGLALLSLKGDFTVGIGDFLTFISGFFFAFHMVFIDRYTMCSSPIRLTVVQMISTSTCCWLMALLFEGPCDLSVFTSLNSLLPLLYLGIVAGMVCFLAQTAAQKYLSPDTTAILLSFESVFGLIFSVIFLKEVITPRMMIGCVLLFSAAILAEYTPSKKKREKMS